MAEKNKLIIENITISSDGRSLTFKNSDNANFDVTFSTHHLSDLLDFLRSVEPDETEERIGFRVPLSLSSGLSGSSP